MSQSIKGAKNFYSGRSKIWLYNKEWNISTLYEVNLTVLEGVEYSYFGLNYIDLIILQGPENRSQILSFYKEYS
jgi:hypothetical protein